MWYSFRENNSGGKFLGPYNEIWVEAESAEEANRIAVDEFEIYFDGCESGIDCSCCGDRWYRVDNPGSNYPTIYGVEIERDTTEDKIIKSFDQTYSLDQWEFKYLIQWKDREKLILYFTKEIIEKMKEEKRNANKKCWGTTYYIGWDEPIIFEAFHNPEYNWWYDKSGNQETQIGWYKNNKDDLNKRFSFGSESKEEVEKVYRELKKYSKKINSIKEELLKKCQNIL